MDASALRAHLPDHEIRAVTLDDMAALHALVARVNLATLGEVDTSEAELGDDLTGPNFDLANDTVLARAPDGEVVAYGQGHDEGAGTGWIDVYVDPELSATRFDEVADALIIACADRIGDSARMRGAEQVTLVANLYEVEASMRAAYERNGFHVETIYWRMIRQFDEHDDLEPPRLPEGLSITHVDPDLDDVMLRGFELYRDTFSEHHGVAGTDVSLDSFATAWRQASSYDRKAWWFAYEGGEAIGMLMGDNRRLEQGEGFIRNLGVRRSHRGKGVARALILTAFAHYRGLGRVGVQLGVDTGNVTNATTLYESVGMRSVLSAVVLERDLTL